MTRVITGGISSGGMLGLGSQPRPGYCYRGRTLQGIVPHSETSDDVAQGLFLTLQDSLPRGLERPGAARREIRRAVKRLRINLDKLEKTADLFHSDNPADRDLFVRRHSLLVSKVCKSAAHSVKLVDLGLCPSEKDVLSVLGVLGKKMARSSALSLSRYHMYCVGTKSLTLAR